MKLLKCEVCGSNDLTKKDGLFVCDYCGAKYSLEEVQKMAGQVNVSGTVSIDSSSRLKSLVQGAHDALETFDLDVAMRYAEQALDIDPNNADALRAMVVCTAYTDGRKTEGYCNRADKHSSETLGIINEDFM